MTIEKTKNRLEELLRLLAIEAKVSLGEVLGETALQVDTADEGILVGRGGEGVQALNYLLKKMAEKDSEDTKFFVDVNGYRKKQIVELEQHARLLAERARSLKYDVEMPPMSAYERLVVHTMLQNEPHVKTESKGEGHERRLVIKYVD